MWCRMRDLNSRPTDYKSVALPAVLIRLYGGADSQNRTDLVGLETQSITDIRYPQCFM